MVKVHDVVRILGVAVSAGRCAFQFTDEIADKLLGSDVVPACFFDQAFAIGQVVAFSPVFQAFAAVGVPFSATGVSKIEGIGRFVLFTFSTYH
jgi:hypothetical protein